MFAIESCYLDFDIIPEEKEQAERGLHAFYTLWDVIRSIKKNLEDLDGDRRVVDVLDAARDLHRHESKQGRGR